MNHAVARLTPLFVASLAMSNAHAQTDWFVDADGVPPGMGTMADPYTSIQFGLSQPGTQSGDRLLVASGTYAESIDFLGKDVVVTHDGVGPMPRILAGGARSAVRFTSGETDAARLVRFIVTGSVPSGFGGEPGGGILVDGANPVLEEVVVRDCSADAGGGIAVLSGGLTLVECQVFDNRAAQAGGGIWIEAGDLILQGGEIRENDVDGFDSQAGGGGLAAMEASSVTVYGTLFRSNRIRVGRGAGIFAAGPVVLEGARIRFNRNLVFDTAFQGGGGIYGPLASGTNCLIQGNGNLFANNAGGAWGGTWVDTTFLANSACGNGGGLYQGIAQNCRFEGNSLSCEDSVGGNGAGAFQSFLTDCTVLENVSRGNGGGTWDCTLVRCVVRGNECTGSFFGDGAGVGLGSATDCLIEGNKAIPGGDPFVSGGGAFGADLLRCIVRGNIAPDGAAVQGGTVDRCTVVHNVAPGNFFTSDVASVTSATVTNSVLWGNEPAEERLSTVTYSNVQDSTPGLGNFSADPLFFGPGSDVHLLSNSPCIDAGDPASEPDLDGSRADVGALPFDPQHVREDGSFCFGIMDLTVDGQLSASSSTAVLTSPGATAFLVSPGAGYSPLIFINSSFSVQASSLCLVAPFARVFPSSSDQLELTLELLDRLGLVPGDRLYVQAYRSFGSNVETSPGLDLLVLP